MLELVASNPLVRTLALLLVFALLASLAFVAIGATSRRTRALGKLRALGRGESTPLIGQLARDSNAGAWARLVDNIERAGLNLTDTKSDELRKKLRAAGFDSPSAPRIFTLVRLVMIFAVPGAYVLLTMSSAEPPTVMRLYLVGATLGLLGLYLPSLFVRARADRRRQEITNGFPDCLDLMLVCVEAGLGLEAALDRVGREMVQTHPMVARLLTEVTLQLRAGASREDALRKLGETAGIDEVRSFTTLLIQSDRLGTSISTTLRVYAAEMREARRMRAEEKAHRLPVLISIPLVVCMLPTMIGVLALPAIIRVVRQVGPALTGGG